MKSFEELLVASLPEEERWKVTLLKKWPLIIGDAGAHVRIEKIRDNVLVLGVTHPVWAQEFFALSDVLRTKINAFLKKDRIVRIRFDIQSGGKRKGSLQVSKKPLYSPMHAKDVVKDDRAQGMLGNITDTQLRSALERYYQRCFVYER